MALSGLLGTIADFFLPVAHQKTGPASVKSQNCAGQQEQNDPKKDLHNWHHCFLSLDTGQR